jgi:hypothetical protein
MPAESNTGSAAIAVVIVFFIPVFLLVFAFSAQAEGPMQAWSLVNARGERMIQ